MAEKSPALITEICERIAKGESLRAISASLGIPLTTAFRWVTDDPADAEQYTRAREAQADTLADELIELADSAEGQCAEGVAAVRLAVDTRKWVASKLRPKRYGDKLDIEHGGGVKLGVVSSEPMTADAWEKAYGA